MPRLVKYLPCKHENPYLIPRIYTKMEGIVSGQSIKPNPLSQVKHFKYGGKSKVPSKNISFILNICKDCLLTPWSFNGLTFASEAAQQIMVHVSGKVRTGSCKPSPDVLTHIPIHMCTYTHTYIHT